MCAIVLSIASKYEFFLLRSFTSRASFMNSEVAGLTKYWVYINSFRTRTAVLFNIWYLTFAVAVLSLIRRTKDPSHAHIYSWTRNCLQMFSKPVAGSLNLLHYQSWWQDHPHIGVTKDNQYDTHEIELALQQQKVTSIRTLMYTGSYFRPLTETAIYLYSWVYFLLLNNVFLLHLLKVVYRICSTALRHKTILHAVNVNFGANKTFKNTL